MIIKCNNCGKDVKRKQSEINRMKHIYCSRSCFAIHSNKIRSKDTYKQPQGECLNCKIPIRKKLKRCKNCDEIYTSRDIKDETLLKDAIYNHLHKSSAFAKIRARARAVAKNLGWKSCSICGYDKHIEISHIKAISEFDENTKVGIINAPSNLRPLCPNCHWEMDNK